MKEMATLPGAGGGEPEVANVLGARGLISPSLSIVEGYFHRASERRHWPPPWGCQ